MTESEHLPLGESGPAPVRVARVLVDTGLAHLDRPFDYAIPDDLADEVAPGVRVRVRFAGRDLAGYVAEVADSTTHEGRLAPVRRVVSPEPVLTEGTLALAERVAEHYAGAVGDVLRLAIPPRHATAERALAAEAPELSGLPPAPDTSAWERYAAGPAFVTRLASGESPWAEWLAVPPEPGGPDWPDAIAEAVRATVESGRGAVIVVPDHRDVGRLDDSLAAALGPGRHVRLTADQGPQARYTAWLKVLRGHVPVALGTRAAAFAPVHDLGLVVWWDDGDDLHEEPRAPYPHVREVLRLRAEQSGAGLLVGGSTRTASVEQWRQRGEVHSIALASGRLRSAVPRVQVAGEGRDLEDDALAASAHLPSVAWRVAREALQSGPVLVQVPRRGYLPSISCQRCRTPAHCPKCGGRLLLRGPTAPPECRWCGHVARDFSCPECGSTRWRSSVVGAKRTAEELGRAFPGVRVLTSGSGAVLERVDETPALVIATPGAEPVATGGYHATLLLDAWASLDRPVLTVGEEALRRWLLAGLLTRGWGAGGRMVLCGAPAHTTVPPVEALVRWDPAWFAGRELADRRTLSMPPAATMALLTGERPALESVAADPPLAGAQPLGLVTAGDGSSRLVLRVPLEQRAELAAALRAMRGARSAHRDATPIGVRMDPPDPGM
ncbi:primosomal protein N' [Actinomycetota bacterium]